MSHFAYNFSGGQLIVTPQPFSNDLRVPKMGYLESLLPTAIHLENADEDVSKHFPLASPMSLGAFVPSTSPIRADDKCFKGNEKRRTRRKSSTSLIGNNRQGRKGKLRCERCRMWKQKVQDKALTPSSVITVADSQCDYESIELPCHYCRSKGLDCGSKVSAENWILQKQESHLSQAPDLLHDQKGITSIIPCQPCTPDHERLSQFEEMHIQSIWGREFLFRFANFQFSRPDSHRLWENVVRRFGPKLSSKSVRYGCILYSFYKQGNTKINDECHLHYLDRFYKSTREAVTHNAYDDLVYGCFAGCLYVLRARQDVCFDEIVQHTKAFRISAHRLVESSVLEREEIFLLECMWEKLVWYMAKYVLFELSATPEILDQLLQFAHPLFLSTLMDAPDWIQESYPAVRAKIQFIRLLVTLDIHLNTDTRRIKQSLMQRFITAFVDPPKIKNDFSALASWLDENFLQQSSRNLWGDLLSFLLELTAGVVHQRTSIRDISSRIASSIHFFIDGIPVPLDARLLPLEFWNFIDLAIYCLAVIGLVSSQLLEDDFGFPS